MGYTNFPNGLTSFGAPVAIGPSFGMAMNSQIYFVDQINGSDGDDGKQPTSAFATIERALVVAGAYDVIYVADPGTSGSDPSTYSGAAANYTVPVASKSLAIIGIAHSALLNNGRPMAPSIYAYQAATPVFTVNAAMVTVEGFRIAGAWDTGGVETAGIAVADFSDGVSEGFGLSVHNCYFEDLNSAGDLGAVATTGQWNTTITNCTFMNCQMGISIVSSGSTNVGTIVDTVKFFSRNGLGTKTLADIYIYCQGSDGILINNVMLGHDAPLLSGNKGANIVAVGGAEKGLISNVTYMDVNGTCHATTGTAIRVPITIGCSNIHDGDNVLIAIN